MSQQPIGSDGAHAGNGVEVSQEIRHKPPEQALEVLQHVKEKMLQQQEDKQQRILTGEERIAKELLAFITSLQHAKMAPEDVTANAYDFACVALCELLHLTTDPVPVKIRLKAAQTLEQVYYEIGKVEGREGMLNLLQAESDKPPLWTKLQELCQQSANGVYQADWDKFFADTGGYTINSLVSYDLLDKLDLYLDYKNRDTYCISLRGKYAMQIHWSDKDNAYIVAVGELPGCMTHGRTYEEALQQGKDAIESWLDAGKAWGDS